MNQPIEFIGVVVGVLVTVLGTVGNIATIATITSNRKLLTVSTAFIVNLSVADLLYSAVLQPITVNSYIASRWELGPVFCSVFGYMLFLLFGVSELTLCAVALNRYFLIVHPGKYRSIYNKTGTAVMITVSWLLPALSLLPPALGVWGRFTFFDKVSTCSFDREVSASFTTTMFSVYCAVPTVIMCFSYACILRTVRTSSDKFNKKKRTQKKRRRNNTCSEVSELNSMSEDQTPKGNGKKQSDDKIFVELEMDDVFIVAGSDSSKKGKSIKRCTFSSSSAEEREIDRNSSSNLELNNGCSDKKKMSIGTRTSSLITMPNLKSKTKRASLYGPSRRHSLVLDGPSLREISPSRLGRARTYFSETDPTSNIDSVCNNRQGNKPTDPDSSARQIRAQNRVSRNVRLAKMTFAVFVAFSVCFLPYMVLSIVDKSNSGAVWLYKLCAMVAWLNSCINPIIYSLMNKQLRNGLLHMLGKCRDVLRKTVTGQDF